MEIFHISVISSNLWRPSHKAWVPGFPSHFLPKKPPRLATIRIASRNVGGFSAVTYLIDK